MRVFIFSALLLISLSAMGDVPDFFNANNCQYYENPIIVKQPTDRFGVCYGQGICTVAGTSVMTTVSCIALPGLQCPDLITCSKDSGVIVEQGQYATLEEGTSGEGSSTQGDGSAGGQQ